MKQLMLSLLATLLLCLFTTSAFAQAEADNERKCQDKAGDIAKDATQKNGKAILAAHGKMVNACAAFRACKKDCRQDKRSCKEDARSDKGQCIADCAKISNKQQEKACKQGCRADKKDCRQDKRACKTQCVATEKQGPCQSARKEFWKLVGETSGKAAKDIVNACESEFSKN